MRGEMLSHFALLEKIGEGGMGRVYKARDSRLERLVAIKLLPESRLADADRRARFIQEARAASALNHPNIITVYDIAEHEGQTFIVMELVEGKALNELIPRKGMRLTEALRVAAQVADALTAAHAAGVVHRDLKPGNIMVDTHGRAKVLDFGLAKLSAPARMAAGAEEATRTMTVEQPRTEEGVVMGTVPYMSPEQVEGKPLDARSDIFSFGAVLYEMVTGQRAFCGESRASTLAAVVEKEPQSPSEITGSTPPELERLIARCLRKDVNRRSQNMADVKLALEELRDESESGKLVRSAGGTPARTGSRWLLPAVAIASIMAAIAAMAWMYVSRQGSAQSLGPDLVRLSPDDGQNYGTPSISADGKFVAYVSDRGGSRQLWLQQVAGGEPIQLTHSSDTVVAGGFVSDGARLLYATDTAGANRGSIEVIPTLGGQSRVVATTKRLLGGALSPDGRQVVYFESAPAHPWARLMLLSVDGGEPRELTSWAAVQPLRGYVYRVTWTRDGRYLLCLGSKRAGALTFEEWEWFVLPMDGGSMRPTGAGDVLRAVGLNPAPPSLIFGDRVLFAGGKSERENVWEIRLSPDSWRVHGAPRQLSFGSENEYPSTVSDSGTVALNVVKEFTNLHFIPASKNSGQPMGVSRRLTQDGRYKSSWWVGGNPGSAYFTVPDPVPFKLDGYALDLTSGRQTLVAAGFPFTTRVVVSVDGRQVAYSSPEGNLFSIRVAESGASMASARLVCKGCGSAWRFSADGRFLFYQPEAKVKPDSKTKRTVHLLDVSSGKDRPWLEHPTDSIDLAGTFSENQAWVLVDVQPVGTGGNTRSYLVPWREEPVPVPEWIEVKLPPVHLSFNPYGNYMQFFQGTKLMTTHFDPKTHAFSEPEAVKYLPGSPDMIKPDDTWGIRGPGMIFFPRELSSSVWLMKLPR